VPVLSASAFVNAVSRLVSVIVAGACRQRAKCSHTADIACACVEHSDELARRYLPVTDSTRMPALAAVLASAASSTLLPIPASPSTSCTRPHPARGQPAP